MSKLIISVSGLRGIVGDSLTPLVAVRFVAAFTADLPPGPVVLSRDGRTTGPMLAELIRGALCASGRDVIDADVAATPTTGVLVRATGAAGGMQISASHNPPAYNGIKLFSGDGRVFTAALGEAVLRRFEQDEQDWADYQSLGSVYSPPDTTSDHLRRVLATVDVERIRGREFRVLLDSNHGAGGLMGEQLLNELGCLTGYLGREPSGKFAHTPEPTAENLEEVRQAVTGTVVDVGFCQDPDADRLAVIDETGRYIGEEYTLALCLDHVLQQRSGAVVANCATSKMSQDVAEKRGSTFLRSAVGEANVVDLMLERDAVFGGEGNGGPIDPQVGFVRDSFVGMALILDGLAAREGKLSTWADEMPRYVIHKTKQTLDPDRVPAALDALQKQFADAQPDRLDGLRLDWPDRWLLVRASNTEPIVRAIAEAPNEQEAIELCRSAAEVIESLS